MARHAITGPSDCQAQRAAHLFDAAEANEALLALKESRLNAAGVLRVGD